MTSAVLILPAAYLAAGNALGEAMGWGAGNYSVPLSPTGTAPATHYGCRAEVGPGFLALMADPPDEAMPVLAVLTADLRETGDGYGHWSDVLASLGLQSVTGEPG
jgi:hypothetical protein